jgi:hypothetical protein
VHDPETISGSAPGLTSAPVLGDGVLTIEIPEKGAIKMDPDMFKLMLAESAGNVQASNRNSRNMFDIASGAMQGTMVSNFKDVGVVEGRTVSGVLATPLASPTKSA